MPSKEQLKRAEASLKEWAEREGMRSPRLESCSTVLQELAGNLCLMKVKHSAKGKVLMRALYGIEAVTVFICIVLVALLSGSSKQLVEFEVPEKFGWFKAFGDLYTMISGELGRQLSCGSVTAIKELKEVETCARKLHALTSTAQLGVENANLGGTVSCSKEVVMSDTVDKGRAQENNLEVADHTSRQCELIMVQSIAGDGVDTSDIKEDAKTVSHTKEAIVLDGSTDEGHKDADVTQGGGISGETNGLEIREELLNCISSMSKSSEGLRLGLDSVSKRVGDFFQVVLTGRDALLCNLRISDGSKAVAEVRS